MSNGWTAERRARQAAAIHGWRPWDRTTGPRTAAGKAKSARNADKGAARREQAKRECLAVTKYCLRQYDLIQAEIARDARRDDESQASSNAQPVDDGREAVRASSAPIFTEEADRALVAAIDA